MTSKMILAACLFLASVTFTNGQGSGVQCGSFRCTENAGCVNGECICGAGFVGYGRFICVPTGQCPCAAFGDPHVEQYDGSRVKSTLPCQFELSIFTAPATTLPCNIQVELVTKPRTNPDYPFRTFTERIKVTITRDNTQLTFDIAPTGVIPASPVGTTLAGTDTIVGVDLTAVVSTFNSFSQVIVPECPGVIFKYDPVNMDTAIGSPRTGAVFGDGFCGNCNANPADDNPFTALTGVLTEAERALSLRRLTATQGTSDGIVCGTIRTSQAACNDTALIDALKCCDVYYDSTYANCLLKNTVLPFNREGLLNVFHTCLDLYCPNNNRVAAANLPVAFASTLCALPAGYVCPV